jgi:hypothetical protein
MRDKEYDKKKPPGVIRIALLGASTVMGSGVRDHETFESILEERLNRELKPAGVSGYEILNFGVAGYMVVNHVGQCENLVFEFEPDVLCYCTHHRTGDRALFRQFVTKDIDDISFPPLVQEFQREISGMAMKDYKRYKKQVKRSYRKMLEWGYNSIVAMCARHDTIPVWIYIPMPTKRDKVDPILAETATIAGFQMISLDKAYDGWDERTLKIASWENHPNAMGHALLAQQLYNKLKGNPKLLGHFDDMKK